MLQEIKVSKSTAYFKVKLVKPLDKYPLKFQLYLWTFLKDYLKTVEEVWKESRDQFK